MSDIPGNSRLFKRSKTSKTSFLSLVPIMLVAAIVLGPIIALFAVALSGQDNIWPHLLATVLPRALVETVLLMTGVGLLTISIGASSAWLVTMYRFPGRKVFVWLSLIPLAMPTYLTAFSYTEIWDYSGFMQTTLRSVFGWQTAQDYWFPEIRSLGGAIFVMSFVLYPYVYLTARASFIGQSICALEVARTLGRSHWGMFWNVGLPLARPALVAGTTLALMETLNDIGAVEHFGVNTLTFSVYNTWLERGSLPGAAQIASIMLIFVVLLLWVERVSRRRQRFYQTTGRYQNISATRLKGFYALAATIACALPILLGFVMPASILIKAAFTNGYSLLDNAFWLTVGRSVLVAGIAAVLAVIIGIFLTSSQRSAQSGLLNGLVRVCSIGYAVPGTVLAIGILIFLSYVEGAIGKLSSGLFGITTGLLVSGTAGALVFAYVVRFMAISHGALDSGFAKLSPNLDAVARSLGRTKGMVLREVHLPLLRPAIGTAALLVFVDSMKELPATLLLRPFNYDTLATNVYTLASLDLFEESAPAALAIVLIGLIPVIILSKLVSTGRPKRRN
ncbi:Ferric iron ABC transporter, permease protein [hydrothermal vent metagenome]|uniref:Ferric iron ABC transporter, permease protein n=1 Tax=hydrothermal vent metagenome TaxID=652676 RepID=A0A3B0S1D5_9ZZZZ